MANNRVLSPYSYVQWTSMVTGHGRCLAGKAVQHMEDRQPDVMPCVWQEIARARRTTWSWIKMHNQGHVTAIECVRGMYAKHSIPSEMHELQNDTKGRTQTDTDNAFIDCDGMVTIIMRDSDQNGMVTENRYMFPTGWFAGNDDGNSKPWHERITQHSGIIIDEHRRQLSEDTLPTLAYTR